MTRQYCSINLEEMIEVLAMVLRNGILKWAPYISAKRKDIHITNHTRTARFLSGACDLVFETAS